MAWCCCPHPCPGFIQLRDLHNNNNCRASRHPAEGLHVKSGFPSVSRGSSAEIHSPLPSAPYTQLPFDWFNLVHMILARGLGVGGHSPHHARMTANSICFDCQHYSNGPCYQYRRMQRCTNLCNVQLLMRGARSSFGSTLVRTRHLEFRLRSSWFPVAMTALSRLKIWSIRSTSGPNPP